MRRAFTHTIPFLLGVVITQAGLGRPAAAAGDPDEKEPSVTPFIDSGNTLPDLGAREQHPAPETPSVRGPWYGWQILLGDVAATTCAFSFQNGACIAPYLLTGPGVHLAHGREGLAAASFGLRLGGPALGGTIGLLLANCPARRDSLDFCGMDYLAVGLLTGAAVAAVVDATLGFERVEAQTKSEPAVPRLPTIEPLVSVGTSRLTIGLGAAF